MAIRFDEYKGFVIDPSIKVNRSRELTTGIDKLSIYEIIEPEKSGENDLKSDLNTDPLESKSSKRIERQQKKVRMSQRKLQKRSEQGFVNIPEQNPYKITSEIKQIYSKYIYKQETKLLQYESVSLYSTDLMQILPGEWINDNIISIIYEYLNMNYLSSSEVIKKSVILLVPSIVQLITFTDFNIIDANDFKSAKFIFFPMNETEEGDHWVLGVLNLLENTFLVYDSMMGDDNDLVKGLIEKLTKIGLITQKVKIIQYKIEQQSNFDDCGVYLVMISCYLIHMLLNDDINLDLVGLKFNPTKGRLDILKLISFLIEDGKTEDDMEIDEQPKKSNKSNSRRSSTSKSSTSKSRTTKSRTSSISKTSKPKTTNPSKNATTKEDD